VNPAFSDPTTHRALPLLALRWLARGLSVLAVGLVLLFAIGEELNLARFTARELVLFVFFPIGVCLGMVVAWRREGLGGFITVASLAAFYLADRVISPGYPRGFAFLAFASPGFLFLICGLWSRLYLKPPPTK
jgi:hypothetical protein